MRLDRRVGAGAVAGAGAERALGAILDPTPLFDLAILGVMGAAAVSAIGGDASPVAEAAAGDGAPAPEAGEPPAGTPSTTTTTRTN